jgi:hypothetical protein
MSEQNLGATANYPDFKALASIEDGCAALGRFLGLEAPVSRDVFETVIDNPTYATALFTARKAPVFRDHLLARPDTCKRRYERVRAEPEETSWSNAALLAKAAKSFIAWGRNGFKTADDVLYKARLAACNACEHNVMPERKLGYQLAAALTGTKADRKICDLCGCVTEAKARLENERCPGQDPARPGFSRWGDPRKPG